jgi:hypothetical protein
LAAATTSKGVRRDSLASRIIYAAVGLSAVYLLGRIRALVGGSERVPLQPELRRYASTVRRRFGQPGRARGGAAWSAPRHAKAA